MKSISELSLIHNRLMLAIVSILMVFGLYSYFTLPAQEDPDITIREALVTASYPGLPADKVELLITKTLEEAARKLPEIDEIRSVSMTGQATLHVKIKDRYFELEQIWDDLRDELEQVTPSLPEGTSTPLVNDSFGDVAVLTIALEADESYGFDERRDIAQHVRDTLFRMDGVKSIDILGARSEQITIAINNGKLANFGMSPEQVIGLLQAQNIIQPGGTIDAGGTNYTLQPSGYFQSLEDVKKALISIPERQETVLLEDIAEVRREAEDPPSRTAYLNGKPVIVFAIAKNDHVDVLTFSPQIEAQLASLNRILPVGMQLTTITRQADVVQNAINGVSINVLETLAIVSAVVLLFLGVKAGLIVGGIVPSVILITISIMAFSGMVLERMSLATLIISLGVLVDNGIVVAEDFKRRLEDGEDREQALANSSRSLAFPLLTSSLTTILVFLPLMLADSVAGEYTRSISLVILIALLVSWLLSQTITPYLCYHFVPSPDGNKKQGKANISEYFNKLNPYYESLLRRVLNMRLLFMAIMVGLFFAGGFALSKVPAKFFPDSDRTQVLVYLDMPAGSSIRKTNHTLARVFKDLEDKQQFPYVQNAVGYGGFGGPRFVLSLTPIDPDEAKGFMMLDIDKGEHVQPTIDALRAQFAAHYPDVFARVTKMFLGPSDSSKIALQIKGPDKDVLFSLSKKLEAMVASLPNTYDIRNDWENRVSRLRIDVNQQKARRAGVSSADIAQTLNTYYSGRIISEFIEGDDILPIIVQSRDKERFDLSRVESINVFSNARGVSVPLLQVADINYETGFSRIARENLFRTISIEAKNHVLNAEEMVPLLTPKLAQLKQQLPVGYSIEYDGVIEESAKAKSSLNTYLPLCIGIIMLLLIAQFRSYRRTLIITLTIPLIIIGAALGLLLMQGDFGFMVILGLYALAGIIVNNGIVLIERIDADRQDVDADDKDAQSEAVVTACVRRLRPILMSSMTTILGLVPLILSGDVLFYAMACAIAFGLALGTVLSLGVVPVLYSLFFGLSPQKSTGK